MNRFNAFGCWLKRLTYRKHASNRKTMYRLCLAQRTMNAGNDRLYRGLHRFAVYCVYIDSREVLDRWPTTIWLQNATFESVEHHI